MEKEYLQGRKGRKDGLGTKEGRKEGRPDGMKGRTNERMENGKGVFGRKERKEGLER